jgi:glycosyltransferase involved in cell wall biosynthesis
MTVPRVSVITIFLDMEAFLPEAVSSVLAQTYADWELLLVDDGSTDRSAQIALEYAEREPHRIRYLAHEGRRTLGMSASRNLGLRHARGEFVAMLDADDVWLPEWLDVHVTLADEHPEVGAVCGPTQYWRSWNGDPNERDALREIGVAGERVVHPPALLAALLRNEANAPATCSTLVRRDLMLSLGGYDDRFRTLFEDRAGFTKIALHTPVFLSERCLDRYRQHPDSSSARAIATGRYDPTAASAAHRAYLEWVGEYLTAEGVTDPDVWAALSLGLWPYRHPVRYAVMSRLDAHGLGRPVRALLDPAEALRVPCHIAHLEVGDPLPVIPTSARSGLAVLWERGVPVGQLTLDPRSGGSGRATLLGPPAAEHSREPRFHDGHRPTVSVVICTRNRPEALAGCLESLARSSIAPDEILVVDNAPSVAARDVVARFPGVRYLFEPSPGLSFARNTGILASHGALVAFTDDDAHVHVDWLRRIAEPFADPSVAVVTGLVLPAELDTEAQALFETYMGFGRGYAPRTFDGEWFTRARGSGAATWELGAGVNMCIRRTALEEVGDFDVRLGPGAAGCSDDSELWYRILAAGYRCQYEPSAVVEHVHRRDLGGLRQQVRAYMRGHVVALLVQFERHAHAGNLRRLLFALPRYYALLAARALIRPSDPRRLLLGAELRGYLAGFAYYATRDRRGHRRGSVLRLAALRRRAHATGRDR